MAKVMASPKRSARRSEIDFFEKLDVKAAYVLGVKTSLPFFLLAAIFLSVSTGFGQNKVKPAQEVDFFKKLAEAAEARTKESVRYDPAYVVLKYPGGDVPADTGVCTDVVIRTYRALGIDLQELVHEDMKANFSKYPKNWELKRADKNIDHRRVPNLQRYFERTGAKLPISQKAADYQVGDLVAWDLNNKGLWHIGVVVGDDKFVHNIGSGPIYDTGIAGWKIVGHYRFKPKGWEPVAEKKVE
ncbi:DUF1287 domain-containing protein [Verrucomicrobiales bacterium]|nr:DUF1287 domain-containing protein [Verrucomicrobiales bacterium]